MVNLMLGQRLDDGAEDGASLTRGRCGISYLPARSLGISTRSGQEYGAFGDRGCLFSARPASNSRSTSR